MKTMFMRSWILATILLGFSLTSRAQMYGTGMMMGMQACPYQQEIGDEAESKIDDINDAKEDLKDIREKLSEARSKKKEIENKMKRAKEYLERRALQGKYLDRIIDHIDQERNCSEYKDAPAKKPEPAPAQSTSMNEGDDQSRMPAAETDRASVEKKEGEKEKPLGSANGNGTDYQPFTRDQWYGEVCDPGAKGRIMSGVCDIDGAKVDKSFSKDVCRTNVDVYQDQRAKLKEATRKFDELQAKETEMNDRIKDLKRDYKTAVKDHQKEMRKEATEGGCIDCMLNGAGYSFRSSKPDWGGVITNSVLGIGSMILGNSLQKYVANQNARIGYPSQSYPSFGYGFPFMMGALAAGMGGGGGFYGSIGGGIGAGGFGCGGGFGGNGYGNMVGGPFGYPPGFFQTPYGGGLFTGYPMGGMLAGGAMAGWPMGGMMGMPMGGYMMGGMLGGMMGYPMGGMMGMPMGGYMMGGMGGGMLGGMMGYPMGGMMGMPMGGYMMGGMGGGMMGMMPGGMMGYPMGGYMMGGMGGGMMGMMPGGMMGYPMGGYMMGGMGGGMMGMMPGGMMGMPMSAMGGGMMGMDSSGMMNMQMQMQQQAMQMQQQQMQMYMQQQQRQQENYANGSRVIMALQQEMQSVQMRMQQAMMSIQSGGYFNFGYGGSFGVGGTLGTPGGFNPGMPGGALLPGQLPGGSATTTTGPSSR